MNSLVLRCGVVFITAPVPELYLDFGVIDRPGLVSTLADQVESVNPALMFAEMTYIISTPSRPGGEEDGRVADLKVKITGGTVAELTKIRDMAVSGELFLAPTAAKARQLNAAMPLVDVPLTGQYKLHVSAATWDSPGLLAEFTGPVLAARGTLHNMSAVTVNSGESPGTADFVIDAVIGFSTQSEAMQAERLLNALSFREMTVTRLFDDLAAVLRLAA